MTAVLLFVDIIAWAWLAVLVLALIGSLAVAFKATSKETLDRAAGVFGPALVRLVFPAAWLLARWWTS